MRVKVRLAGVAAVAAIVWVGCTPERADPPHAPRADHEPAPAARVIPIPTREHGYSNFESTAIGSPAELERFLRETSRAAGMGWNDRAAFEAALAGSEVDFARERLVLLRHTEGSGSVRVEILPPRLVQDRLVVRVDRAEPEVGTADMAYYCWALAVDRDRVDSVVLEVAGRRPVVLELR